MTSRAATYVDARRQVKAEVTKALKVLRLRPSAVARQMRMPYPIFREKFLSVTGRQEPDLRDMADLAFALGLQWSVRVLPNDETS